MTAEGVNHEPVGTSGLGNSGLGEEKGRRKKERRKKERIGVGSVQEAPMPESLDDEHARLLKQMSALEREHRDLHPHPHDLERHRRHRERLQAHVAALRAHIQRLRATKPEGKSPRDGDTTAEGEKERI